MEDVLFRNIMDSLQEVLPTKWKNVMFYAVYTQGSYSMKYYIDLGDGQYKDCFCIGNVSRIQLAKLFIKIDKEITAIRNKLNDTARWNAICMMVDCAGYMKTDFNYIDIGENLISFEREWVSQHLH